MAYPVTVIQVMIASPSDVETERSIVREVLYEWNDINCRKWEMALMPVGWETHSAPELGDRPQELLNKRLLKDCDILVGVFWTRIGTPTGKAPSGTIEEIREHHSAGKPTMIYFSSKPISPDNVDQDQYYQVQNFKEWCKNEGLIEEFNSEQEFREKLSRQLGLTLEKNEYIRESIDTNMNFSETHSDEIFEVTLSEDAQELLLAAADGSDGNILTLRTLGGFSLQTGGKSFGGSYGREAARWEGALNELLELDLAVERGYKGEVFELTLRGWEVADEIRSILSDE